MAFDPTLGDGSLSLTMGIGTSVGGMKIIKSVGMDMVKLEKYQGFSADVTAAICLFLSSYLVSQFQRPIQKRLPSWGRGLLDVFLALIGASLKK